MMNTLLWLLLIVFAVLALFYGTWLHYTALMNIKRVRDAGKLTHENEYMGYLALGLGSFLNLVLAVVVGSLVFWEWPRWGEWGLTKRVTRIIDTDHGWRARRALWVRTRFLDHIDPDGIHRA